MSNNKTVCKTQKLILYPNFLSSKFIEAALRAFIGKIIFDDTFVDTLSAAFILPSHIITDLLIVPAKY